MSDDMFVTLSFFEGLNPADLAALRPLFAPCDFYAETILFQQGDPAENLYIVVVGEVTVNYKPDDGPPITVTRVRPGGVVGWSAALGSKSYTSGAVCTTYTQLLRIRGADLRRLCEEHPQTGAVILERLAAVIAERLRNTHPQVVAMLQNAMLNGANHSEAKR
jgi:CRP-like cAMP-binding protein